MSLIKIIRVFVTFLALALVLTVILPEDVFGKRGSSGRRSYSRSRSSSAQKSKPAQSSWGNKSKSVTGTRSAKSNKSSPADKALYNKARKNGTAFKTRESAVKDFQQKHGSQYPSTYAQKPSTRPAHIPETMSVDGKNHRINYDQGRGGYGYYGPSGGWIAYSVIRDVAMLNLLMNNHSYHYGPRPGGGFSFLTTILIIGAIIALIIFLKRRRS